MDPRARVRASTSSADTTAVPPPYTSSHKNPTNQPTNQSNQTRPTKSNDNNSQLTKLNEQKLDAILSTVKTLQESIRELKNEFSALKPRIGTFQTTTTCPGMIVKAPGGNNAQSDIQKLMAKRRKPPV